MRLHAESTAPSPKAFNPRVPDDLTDVVRCALEKIPERRFASAGEMEAALAAVLLRGSLSPAEGSTAGEISAPKAWVHFLKELVSPKGLKNLWLYPVRVGLLDWSLPFGVILALQFLASFLVALAFLYGLHLLAPRLF